MHRKCHRRLKDGKEHRDWSIVENRRCRGGRMVRRPGLYLGEINNSQTESRVRCIEAFDPQLQQQVRLALFPADRPIPEHASACGVQVRLRDFIIRLPRQWGAGWLFLELWHELQLDRVLAGAAAGKSRGPFVGSPDDGVRRVSPDDSGQ